MILVRACFENSQNGNGKEYVQTCHHSHTVQTFSTKNARSKKRETFNKINKKKGFLELSNKHSESEKTERKVYLFSGGN
jgi:hypothetical protein